MNTPPPMRKGNDFFGRESSISERERSPHRERALEEMMKTVWLTPENARFALHNGLLWLETGDRKERVSLRRAFPFEELWTYLSVLNQDEEEVGMIRDLSGFEEETATLLKEELERRYYSPVVLRILSLKERYGFSYWKVETAEGIMEFTLRDTYKSLIHLDSKRIIILDVDGNRFEIPDVTRLDRKSYRKIELYL